MYSFIEANLTDLGLLNLSHLGTSEIPGEIFQWDGAYSKLLMFPVISAGQLLAISKD